MLLQIMSLILCLDTYTRNSFCGHSVQTTPCSFQIQQCQCRHVQLPFTDYIPKYFYSHQCTFHSVFPLYVSLFALRNFPNFSFLHCFLHTYYPTQFHPSFQAQSKYHLSSETYLIWTWSGTSLFFWGLLQLDDFLSLYSLVNSLTREI